MGGLTSFFQKDRIVPKALAQKAALRDPSSHKGQPDREERDLDQCAQHSDDDRRAS